METIKRNRKCLLVIIYIVTIPLFSCKTKYEKVSYIDSKTDIFLNGPYLKEKSSNGYFFQHIYTKLMTFNGYTSEEPTLWGYRIGKYKNRKQKGDWITYTFWESDRVLEEPQFRRKERFKDGLQNGSYIIYDGRGHVIYYTEFKNGTGIEKDFYPNGQLYYEITKKDGYFTDTLKLYDDLGRLSEMLYFEKDSLVFSKEKHYLDMRGAKR